MPVKEAKDFFGLPKESRFDFEDLIWQQVNRVGEESRSGSDGYLRAVENLRDMLSAHEDDLFITELLKIEKDFEEVKAQVFKTMNKNPNWQMELQKDSYIKARILLRSLMRLIKRAGFIPAKAVDFEETETEVYEDGEPIE